MAYAHPMPAAGTGPSAALVPVGSQASYTWKRAMQVAAALGPRSQMRLLPQAALVWPHPQGSLHPNPFPLHPCLCTEGRGPRVAQGWGQADCRHCRGWQAGILGCSTSPQLVIAAGSTQAPAPAANPESPASCCGPHTWEQDSLQPQPVLPQRSQGQTRHDGVTAGGGSKAGLNPACLAQERARSLQPGTGDHCRNPWPGVVSRDLQLRLLGLHREPEPDREGVRAPGSHYHRAHTPQPQQPLPAAPLLGTAPPLPPAIAAALAAPGPPPHHLGQHRPRWPAQCPPN